MASDFVLFAGDPPGDVVGGGRGQFTAQWPTWEEGIWWHPLAIGPSPEEVGVVGQVLVLWSVACLCPYRACPKIHRKRQPLAAGIQSRPGQPRPPPGSSRGTLSPLPVVAVRPSRPRRLPRSLRPPPRGHSRWTRNIHRSRSRGPPPRHTARPRLRTVGGVVLVIVFGLRVLLGILIVSGVGVLGS